MPSELRIIRFRLDEAERALRGLAPRIGLMLPDGAFTSAQAMSDPQGPCTCFEVEGGENKVRVSNGQLAASLIYSCRQGQIELPDEGTKEIYTAPEFIELRIVLRHSAPQAANFPNGQTVGLETVNRQNQQSS